MTLIRTKPQCCRWAATRSRTKASSTGVDCLAPRLCSWFSNAGGTDKTTQTGEGKRDKVKALGAEEGPEAAMAVLASPLAVLLLPSLLLYLCCILRGTPAVSS